MELYVFNDELEEKRIPPVRLVLADLKGAWFTSETKSNTITFRASINKSGGGRQLIGSWGECVSADVTDWQDISDLMLEPYGIKLSMKHATTGQRV